MRRGLHVWIRYTAGVLALLLSPLGLKAAYAQEGCAETLFLIEVLTQWFWYFVALGDWGAANVAFWALGVYVQAAEALGCL